MTFSQVDERNVAPAGYLVAPAGYLVAPAKAGAQVFSIENKTWIPACAGMTNELQMTEFLR